jgi:hypothetical protein
VYVDVVDEEEDFLVFGDCVGVGGIGGYGEWVFVAVTVVVEREEPRPILRERRSKWAHRRKEGVLTPRTPFGMTWFCIWWEARRGGRDLVADSSG